MDALQYEYMIFNGIFKLHDILFTCWGECAYLVTCKNNDAKRTIKLNATEKARGFASLALSSQAVDSLGALRA